MRGDYRLVSRLPKGILPKKGARRVEGDGDSLDSTLSTTKKGTSSGSRSPSTWNSYVRKIGGAKFRRGKDTPGNLQEPSGGHLAVLVVGIKHS